MTRHCGRSVRTIPIFGGSAMAPSSALEPKAPILTQPGPGGAVESFCDLDYLEVALRRGGDGGAGALGRAAGADQGAGRAPRHPRAVPRAALLDPASRRP